MRIYHTPVLLKESVDGLAIRPDGIYVDATFGGGGHAREILNRLGDGTLFAFDQDEDAAGNAFSDHRLFFIRHNFRYLKNFLRFYDVEQVDGILADLGVSSHDFDEASRGFSFRFEGALDMRMNRDATFTAADIVNQYDHDRLATLFREYGEMNNAGRLAAAVVAARQVHPLNTTGQLLKAIEKCVPKAIEKKYLAQVFQALRMEVNDETGALREFLTSALDVLRPGGRLVVITYHSIEDRLVKNFMKAGNFEGKIHKDFYGNVLTPFELVNRKVVVPAEEEVAQNPRSRSAKLRIAEKTGE